jgi:hypothetical protein
MEARCPRCSTVFTTDRSGIQFCPNCGQQVDVPEPPGAESWGSPPGGRFDGGGMPPPRGPGPTPAGREFTPWERRKELGVVQGFFETWKRSVFSPHTFFPTVRADVPWTEALWYAWILHGIAVVLGLPIIGLGLATFGMPRGLPGGGSSPEMEQAMRAISGGVTVGQLLLSMLLYPIVILIVSGVLHLVAMLLGSAKNGYGATVRAVCYSAGANILGFIPCLGFLAAIYGLVLAVFAISSLQETTYGKAVAIVLIPIVFIICCCGLFFAGLFGMIATMAGMGKSQSL